MGESSELPPTAAKSSRFPWLLPVAVWSAIAVAYLVCLDGRIREDFFITFRYARNLARGYGFVFNPGERVFGTTDPGLGLLLGGLHFVTRMPVPLLSTVIFALSLVGIATIFLIAGRRRGLAIEAVLGGTLLMTSAYLWSNQGAAAPFAILLLLLASLMAARSMIIAGLLAGAAAWVRPDAGLGVAVLALLLLESKRVPWRYLVAAGCVIAVGLGLAWLYFGYPLPNTLGVKTEQAAAFPGSGSGLRFWPQAAILIRRQFGRDWPPIVILGAVGCWPLAAKGGRPGRLLALFGLAIGAAYPLLGAPFTSWYILPCVIAVIYGLAFFAGAAGRALAARVPSLPSARALIASCLFALLLVGTLAASWSFLRSPRQAGYLQSYRRGADWIKAHSAADASIAYVEIGVIGYYSERPILDLVGLVTPWVRPYALRNDLLGALRQRPTEFVLHHTRGRMGQVMSSHWFKRRYQEVMRFEDPGEGRKGVLQIFRRRAGQRMPDTRRDSDS